MTLAWILAASVAGGTLSAGLAAADLIPGLHRRPELRDTAFQALLIGLGIEAIAMVRAVVPH